jgi:hypothetical protein
MTDELKQCLALTYNARQERRCANFGAWLKQTAVPFSWLQAVSSIIASADGSK